MSGVASHGTIVARQNLGVGGFTDINGLLTINPPGTVRTEIETTDQADDNETYLPGGVSRRGPFSFDFQYDPADTTHQGLFTSADAGQIDGWRVTFPDGGTEVNIFSGFITSVGPPVADVDGKLVATCTVRPTADFTYPS